jgi:hypothetical protein
LQRIRVLGSLLVQALRPSLKQFAVLWGGSGLELGIVAIFNKEEAIRLFTINGLFINYSSNRWLVFLLERHQNTSNNLRLF